jgi:hypothetical protein
MGNKDIQRSILGWIIICGFFALTGYLLHMMHTGQQVSDSTGSLFMLFGSVSTMAGTVVGFYFGSTQTAKERGDQLASIAAGKPLKEEPKDVQPTK